MHYSFCLKDKKFTSCVPNSEKILKSANNRLFLKCLCSECGSYKTSFLKGHHTTFNSKIGYGNKKTNKTKKDMSSVPYCGIKKVPRGRKRGTTKECKESNQIRFYGWTNVDVKTLFAPKPKNKPIKQVKTTDKKVQPSSKIKAQNKNISSNKTDNIKIQKLKTNNNVIKLFNDIWYIHPKYTRWAVNKSGEVIFLPNRTILKPTLTSQGMFVNIKTEHGPKSYPVHKLVYESIYDIDNLFGTVNHIDGNIKNNHIDNLGWSTFV